VRVFFRSLHKHISGMPLGNSCCSHVWATVKPAYEAPRIRIVLDIVVVEEFELKFFEDSCTFKEIY